MPKPGSKTKLVNRGPAGLLKKGGNKLANRGPAGLLSKLEKERDGKNNRTPQKTELARVAPGGKINNVPKALTKPEIVPIRTLKLDPLNARLHPEKNIELIKVSLSSYGQQTPLVVRRKNRVVIKGNGTLEAAEQLGWTEIAVIYTDLDDLSAAGYGVADNRTAEFAKWNFQIVARIDKMLADAGRENIVGWSSDEIEVLRAADWSKPEISDEEFNADDGGKLVLTFASDQADSINQAVQLVRNMIDSQELSPEQCVGMICNEWLGSQAE